MPRKRYSVEQIINHLREAEVLLAQGQEVLLAQGQTVGEVCRRIGVSEQNWATSYSKGKSPTASRRPRC